MKKEESMAGLEKIKEELERIYSRIEKTAYPFWEEKRDKELKEKGVFAQIFKQQVFANCVEVKALVSAATNIRQAQKSIEGCIKKIESLH